MKFLLAAAIAASFFIGGSAVAQPGDRNHDRGAATDRKKHEADGQDRGRAAATRTRDRRDSNAPAARVNQASQPVRDASPDRRGRDGNRTDQRPAPSAQFGNRSQTTNNSARPNRDSRWSRGDRVPDQYRNNQHYVNDWQQYGLRRPSSGYRWVRNDDNDFYLTLIATGVILETVYRSDRDTRWRDHYSRNYSYGDDIYYQQCRRSADPAGILAGGLIGGLLGNAAGGRRHLRFARLCEQNVRRLQVTVDNPSRMGRRDFVGQLDYRFGRRPRGRLRRLRRAPAQFPSLMDAADSLSVRLPSPHRQLGERGSMSDNFANAYNRDTLDEMYRRFRADPGSVDATWRAFFAGMEFAGNLDGASQSAGTGRRPQIADGRGAAHLLVSPGRPSSGRY